MLINKKKIRLVKGIFLIIYILGVFAYLGIITLYRINLNEEVSLKINPWDMVTALVIPLFSLVYPYYLIVKKTKHSES